MGRFELLDKLENFWDQKREPAVEADFQNFEIANQIKIPNLIRMLYNVLICLFSNKESNLSFVRSNIRGQVIAIKRNKRSGEIGAAPVAATFEGAENLSLLLPVADGLYGIVCENSSRRR